MFVAGGSRVTCGRNTYIAEDKSSSVCFGALVMLDDVGNLCCGDVWELIMSSS